MRIAVIGAGAIGGSLGALLARSGQDIVLVGRPENVAAIRSGGLHVDGFRGDFTAHVDAQETLDRRPDLVLLAVKTQDVIPALRQNASVLDGVPLVTLQNGLRSDELAASVLTPAQLVSGVVVMSATYLTPGQVTLIDEGNLVIGRPFGPNDDALQRIADVLGKAVNTRISDNIRGAHWTKLMINLNNALPAMTNLSVSEAIADDRLSRLAVALIREGLQVADRAGVRLETLPGIRVSSLRLLSKMPIGLAAGRFAAANRRLWSGQVNLGSTLQSIRRGRPTEIDYLNGEIVKQGADVGVPAPLNAKVAAMVHNVEHTGRFYSVTEAMKEIGSLD